MVASRTAARRAILDGRVSVSGIDKPRPASLVAESTEIEVAGAATRFVGRGGEKLAGALDRFGIDVTGVRALDVGASTGGFTDCLLQRGAASVLAIDVGTGQLHDKLRDDPRVTSWERRDIRTVAPVNAGVFDVIVVDVSFVSLGVVAATISTLGRPERADWLVLVKPQFEVGPGGRSRTGVVTDPSARSDAVAAVLGHLTATGLTLRGFAPSPVRGTSGNAEYFAWLTRAGMTSDLGYVTPGDDDGPHD